MEIEIKYFDDVIKDTHAIEYQSNGAAAIDVRACISESIILEPGQDFMIPLGFAIHICNTDVAAMLLPRSGMAKEGFVLGNLVGLIDSDYQQEIHMLAWNRGVRDIQIEPYSRVAQMIFLPVIRAKFKEVKEFSTLTVRGGFGSTGKL